MLPVLDRSPVILVFEDVLLVENTSGLCTAVHFSQYGDTLTSLEVNRACVYPPIPQRDQTQPCVPQSTRCFGAVWRLRQGANKLLERS